MNTWHISEEGFDPQKLLVHESIYTIGNGYFGTRGSFEEGYPGSTESTLLSGVFDDISVGKEEMADVPDWLPIRLIVNNEHFRLDRGTMLTFSLTLDMQRGMFTRSIRWLSPRGIQLRIVIERFASLSDVHLGTTRYSVTLEELPRDIKQVDVIVWAAFNIATGNYNVMHFQEAEQNHTDDVLWLHTQTRHSHVQLVQAMTFTTHAPAFQQEILDLGFAPSIRLKGTLARGETVSAEKIVSMYTSRDTDDPCHQAIMALQQIAQSGTHAYKGLLEQHEAAWRNFWHSSDIIIEGDEAAQQAIRYSIYQLRINAPSHDDHFSIAAKGLTGFGYHGHIFHDTEIFMVPFFTYTHPAIARNLLLYRYHLLPAARAKASQHGYEGAQFPWESSLDGQEACPTTMMLPGEGLRPVLNGELEQHITSSVAFASWQYWHVTGDDDFMRDYGAEVVLSTAQFWASRAEYNQARHAYEINDVIGPDEWHEHVNNDVYTNYMARWNIQTALDVLSWLRRVAPDQARKLSHTLTLTEEQLAHWQEVAELLSIPHDQQTGRFEQFDGFFGLAHLDQAQFKDRTTSYQNLLGMEKLQHLQIIKQADALMLLSLLSQRFDLDTKRANWDYYYPITDQEHGSSLTPALHVILACELGHQEAAHALFLKGTLIDLEDLHGDTNEGIHLAICGAAWQAVVLGFAGLRLHEHGYTTQPCLPPGWTRLAFTFIHRGQSVFVDLRPE